MTTLTPDFARPLEGRHHNLVLSYQTVNEAYFDGTVGATVRWAQVTKAILDTDGQAWPKTRTVLISPVFDVGWVPKYFFNWIMFHELLHLVHGDCGTSVIDDDYYHTAEFFHSESRYLHLEKAKAWHEKNLDRIAARAEAMLKGRAK